jgi:photosystem II stability/assembly factor-like uncharacterized protein
MPHNEEFPMKKFILAILCFFLASCGTFNLKVQNQPEATETVQHPESTTSVSILPTTPIPPEPTGTAIIEPLLTPTLAQAEPISISIIQMNDARQGWGVESSGRIITTKDGGGLWSDVTPFQGRFDAQGFYAFDTVTAWAVPSSLETNNVLWLTRDGGVTWITSQPIHLGEGKYRPLSLQFPDLNHGWLLVMAEISDQFKQIQLYKSDDGGKNWASVDNLNISLPASYLPETTTMTFFNAQTGWIGGGWDKNDPTQWLIPSTSDGGEKWRTDALRLPEQKPTKCNGRALSVLAPGSMAVEITCTNPKDPKYLYHRLFFLSTNGTSTWQSWVLTGEARGVYILNAKQAWIMVTSNNPQMSQILYTRDGGGAWDKFSDVKWKQARFDFVSDKLGWAVAGSESATALFRTENGGRVWIQVRPALLKP